MGPDDVLGCLEARWQNYLKQQSHYIYQIRTCLSVIRSRDSRKARYRWLLLIEDGLEHTPSKTEQSNIRLHLRQAKAKKESAYLVVGFTQEPRRIIVLPAAAGLKAEGIHLDKGGIAWDE